MQYSHGDGYTFCCNVTLPIEADSTEEASIEFEEAAIEAHKHVLKYGWSYGKFIFRGCEFSYYDFWCGDSMEDRIYIPPMFSTIDEWFSA